MNKTAEGWIIMYYTFGSYAFPYIEEVFTSLQEAKDTLKELRKENKDKIFWLEKVILEKNKIGREK